MRAFKAKSTASTVNPMHDWLYQPGMVYESIL